MDARPAPPPSYDQSTLRYAPNTWPSTSTVRVYRSRHLQIAEHCGVDDQKEPRHGAAFDHVSWIDVCCHDVPPLMPTRVPGDMRSAALDNTCPPGASGHKAFQLIVSPQGRQRGDW
jgi:hypothetical protein